MEILNTYIINEDTIQIIPFIFEDGEVYTFVIEKKKAFIISKPPSRLIDESKKNSLKRRQLFQYQDCWQSIRVKDGEEQKIFFELTVRLK